jgi:RNA polymerase sigma-70 factor (ECF subfamily)
MTETKKSVAELYSEYADEILAYSISLLKNYDDARDVVQEVFIRFMKSENEFRHECSYKTWLMVITRNYCYTFLRNKSNGAQRINDEDTHKMEMNLEMKISLNSALERLSQEDSEIIYLRMYAGYSYQEIAEIIGITVNNVGLRLFKLKKQIKNILK